MIGFLVGGLVLAAVAFGGAYVGDPFAKNLVFTDASKNANWTTEHRKAAK